MAQNATLTLNYQIGGTQFSSIETRTAEGAISQIIDLPAGIAGTMDGTTGVDAIASGHGLTTGDDFDLHYDLPADGVHKVRRGLKVDGSTANAITFDETPAGIGDALPADGVACVIGVQKIVNIDFVADELEILAVKSTVKANVDFFDATVSQETVKFAGKDSWFWIKDFSGYTNPLAGIVVASARVSNGGTVAGVVNIALLYDSVP